MKFGLGNDFSEDPFKEIGGGPSPFTEDPFAGLGQEGSGFTDQASSKDPFVSVSDLSSLVSTDQSGQVNSVGQSSNSISSDPFAAFLDTDPTNEPSSLAAPSNDWLESMERDADNSLSQTDLGSLIGTQVTTGSIAMSSQTSDSLLNLSAFGKSGSDVPTSQTVTSPNVTESITFPEIPDLSGDPVSQGKEVPNQGLSPIPEKIPTTEQNTSSVNNINLEDNSSLETKDTASSIDVRINFY